MTPGGLHVFPWITPSWNITKLHFQYSSILNCGFFRSDIGGKDGLKDWLPLLMCHRHRRPSALVSSHIRVEYLPRSAPVPSLRQPHPGGTAEDSGDLGGWPANQKAFQITTPRCFPICVTQTCGELLPTLAKLPTMAMAMVLLLDGTSGWNQQRTVSSMESEQRCAESVLGKYLSPMNGESLDIFGHMRW